MSSKKSIYKTITWRIMASLTTVILVYIFSGELKVAGSVVILEALIKSIIYYVHEKLWEENQAKKISA